VTVPDANVTPTDSPSRNDAVTIPCPACGRLFVPSGKRRWCSDACRVAAWRRQRQVAPAVPNVPKSRLRRPITVYQCDACGERSVGSQRCDDCGVFMRKVALGGTCPHCSEAVALSDLFDSEVLSTS
jgi:hypothetical protein